MHPNRRTTVLFLVAAAASCAAPRRSLARGLASPGDDEREAFLRAVAAGDVRTVRARLEEDPSLATATDDAGRSAFVIACLADSRGVRAALREQGIELDIVEAAMAGDHERFAALAEAHPELVNALHPIGGTPLHGAALVGRGDLWRERSAGCDSNAAPEGGCGFTPARSAMDAPTPLGAWISATDLLSNGGDVNAPQRGGDSVLHGAVRRRDERLVRLVVRKGADLDAVDEEGRTPRELAAALGWAAGAGLLADPSALARDHRASRFAYDVDRRPVERIPLDDVPRELQSEVTGSSHMNLPRVRELVGSDPRLVFSISTDDELAIEASAHIGSRDIIRFHLEHGAPCSLPTAVSLGDRDYVRFLLDADPRLVNERGAHDFPVLWYAVLGRSGPEMVDLLVERGASLDQESLGVTALHWCVLRGERDLAAHLIEAGADLDSAGYKWAASEGQTPLQLARAKGRAEMERLLVDAGARG